MSQSDLASQLGLTFQQVQKYEKGTNRIGAGRLQRIAGILDVQLPFLFQGAPTSLGKARNSSDTTPSRYVTDILAQSDGHALIRAFARIKSPAARRALVKMAEALADARKS